MPLPTKGQEVTPDGTTATSVNSADGSNFDINGGDKAGGNLFHSFGNFGVPTGGSANFLNSPDVENIINRVTGGNVSSIDGLISANGSANLFLINPAGIIFGQNARLDIGGSFLGSTADSLLFNDGTEFSAVNATGKPLLTINAPIGLNFRDTPGDIVNRSAIDDNNIDNIKFGLELETGKNLALVGGNVSLERGAIFAPEGRVELGGLNSSGTVGINSDGSLSFPENVERGNVSLSDNSAIGVVGKQGGSVVINAKDINLVSSLIKGGTFLSSGEANSQSGNITFNATGTIDLDTSNIENSTEIGNAGNIDITTGSLNLSNAELNTETSSPQIGNAGNITINANDNVSLDKSKFTSKNLADDGKSGEINITAKNFSMRNFSLLSSERGILGKGDAGKININATENVSFDRSDISTNNFAEEGGNSGDINIVAKNLFLTNFANIDSKTFTQGDSGNITINTTEDISLDKSDIEADISLFGEGKGGDINLNSRNLFLNNSSSVSTENRGKGNLGNITINTTGDISLNKSDITGANSSIGEGTVGNIDLNTKNLSLTNNSSVSTENRGKGSAGNITINATDNIFLDASRIESGNFSVEEGKAGEINIKSRSLSMANLAQLVTSTSGIGDAGKISIITNDAVKLSNSLIFSNVETRGVGNGGNIDITAKSLFLENGSQLQTLVRGTESGDFALGGKGNAGKINLQISDTININGQGQQDNRIFGSGIVSSIGLGAQGTGGEININARSIFVDDSGFIDSSTLGIGNTGNITISANDEIKITSDAQISNNVETGAKGNGGEIKIDTSNLSLVDRGKILSVTGGEGNAGDVNINARSISLTSGSEILTSTLGNGKAGNISVNATDSFTISGFASLPKYPGGRAGFFPSGLASSSEDNALGEGGEILINTSKLSILNGGVLSARSRSDFKGGTITINANNLELSGGGQIVTSAFKNGNSGDVNLNIKDRVSISGNDPTFFSRKEQLNSLFGNNQGDFTIDNVSPNSGIFANALSSNGGDINLTVGNILSLRDGGKISAQVGGGGNGGNITINTPNGFVVASPKQDNDIVATADKGKGGIITINATRVYGFDKKQIQSITNPSSLINNGENDINSTSANPQLSGSVRFNTDRLDPTQGINQLPVSVLEPDNTVSQACSGSGDIAENKNSFTIVGRGGLPQNPTEPLNSFIVAGNAEVQRGGGAEENRKSSVQESDSINAVDSNDLVPARGVAVNEKGQVVLTRYPNRNTSDRNVSQSNSCSDRPTLSEEVDRVQRTNKNNHASKHQTPTGYIFPDNYLVGFN